MILEWRSLEKLLEYSRGYAGAARPDPRHEVRSSF